MKKKIQILFAALLTCFAVHAAEPSTKLSDTVDNIQSKCPIDINRGWVIQNVCVDSDGVTMTMIVDVTANDFAAMQNDSAELKNRFLQGFSQKTGNDGLPAQTAAAGLPLTVDIVCPESVETITLNFTPSELQTVLSPN